MLTLSSGVDPILLLNQNRIISHSHQNQNQHCQVSMYIKRCGYDDIVAKHVCVCAEERQRERERERERRTGDNRKAVVGVS